jgi:class 3 adenylate cyclase
MRPTLVLPSEPAGHDTRRVSDVRYARTTDGTHVAYEVTGGGPVDIVLLRAWHTDIEHEWNEPVLARMMRRLGSTGRLIRFDRRGMGLSDRPAQRSPSDIEERLDDLRTVLDAAASRRAVLVGLADGATLFAVFAATFPQRTRGLVMWEPSARWQAAPDYPWGWPPEEWPAFLERLRGGWGTPELARRWIAMGGPSRADDERFASWLVEHQNRSGSADDAVTLAQQHYDTDIAPTLPTIHVPTLVLARSGSGADEAQYVADRIPGSRMVVLPGDDHFAIAGDTDAVIYQIESFIHSVSAASDQDPETDRVLATLLFTDVVGSTARAAALGDRAWTSLIERHHERARELVERHRGRLVDTVGDGILASFDGPGRAIRCARAVVEDVGELGLEVRAGLHTGECLQVGDRLRGLAVHIGARVGALAGPSEVLVSSTVKDLVAGAGFSFEDRGVHELKGISGEWRLFAVSG